MSKHDQRPIDSLKEEFGEPSESIASDKNSSESSEQSSDSSTLNLEDIRTAGF
jgi:hypothetical protein